jgi:hypothetical protein
MEHLRLYRVEVRKRVQRFIYRVLQYGFRERDKVKELGVLHVVLGENDLAHVRFLRYVHANPMLAVDPHIVVVVYRLEEAVVLNVHNRIPVVNPDPVADSSPVPAVRPLKLAAQLYVELNNIPGDWTDRVVNVEQWKEVDESFYLLSSFAVVKDVADLVGGQLS